MFQRSFWLFFIKTVTFFYYKIWKNLASNKYGNWSSKCVNICSLFFHYNNAKIKRFLDKKYFACNDFYLQLCQELLQWILSYTSFENTSLGFATTRNAVRWVARNVVGLCCNKQQHLSCWCWSSCWWRCWYVLNTLLLFFLMILLKKN